MKNPVKTTIILLLVFSTFGCEDELMSPCVQGKVIGYQPCYNMLLIEVFSTNLGEPLTLGDKYYKRVVQQPNELLTGSHLNNEDTVYFRYKAFDPEQYTLSDNNIDQLCHPSIAPFPIPTIAITDYSTKKCP